MIRLGILGSTRGTLFPVLVDAITVGELAADIAIVVSNKETSQILERARIAGVPSQFVEATGLTREGYDQKISQIMHDNQVDLIVLLGYMRILSDAFVTEWAGRVINVHPSLLPAFAGLMDLDVHRAVIEAGASETGCTVHYVTKTVDDGPIILQKRCEVLTGDSPEALKSRVQSLEGKALIEAIQVLAKHN